MIRKKSPNKLLIAVTDFGLTEVLPHGKRLIKLCGTTCYIAPEVFSISGHSFGADIFAAGATMYNLATFSQLYSPKTIEDEAEMSKNFNLNQLD